MYPFLDILTAGAEGRPAYLLVIGEHHLQSGEPELAQTSFARASSLLSDGQREHAVAGLARSYDAQNAWSEAADTLADIASRETDTPITRSLAGYLFNAGRYEEALDLAAHIRKTVGAAPVITEVEAKVRTFVGELSAATAIYDELRVLQPQRLDFVVSAIQCRLSSRDIEGARQLAESTALAAVDADGYSLMALAQLRKVLGVAGPIEAGYAACVAEPANPRVLLGYVALVMGLGDEEFAAQFPNPTHVSAEAGAECVSDTTVTWWLLSSGQAPDVPGIRSFKPHSPEGRQLTTLTAGDELSMGGYHGRIRAVISKYIVLARAILEHFNERFPESTALRKVKVTEDDISEFLETLEQREASTRQVMSMYNSGRLPLASGGRFLRIDAKKAWDGLVSTPRQRLRVNDGKPGPLNVSPAVGTVLVLDLTTLLAFQKMGQLEPLSCWPDGLVVSQWTLDELVRTSFNNDFMRPDGRVWSSEGKFYLADFSASDEDAAAKESEELIEWIERCCSVVPLTSALKLGRDAIEQLCATVGRSAAGATLLAEAGCGVLVADDLGLRQVAFSRGVRFSAWSQGLLLSLSAAGIIDEAQSRDAVATLCRLNYWYVHISKDDIVWAAKRGMEGSAHELGDVLRPLSGSDSDLRLAVEVALQAIRDIWIAPEFAARRGVILEQVLDALATERVLRDVYREANRALKQVFLPLLALQASQVLDAITTWEKKRPRIM